MNAPALARSLVWTPVRAVVRGLSFLSDLKCVFRSSPLHTNDEQNAIRGLASIHPAIPRKIARLRARFVERAPAAVVDADKTEPLFPEAEMQRCVAALQENGVHAFAQRLPQPLVASLKRSLAALPAYIEDRKRPQGCVPAGYRRFRPVRFP